MKFKKPLNVLEGERKQAKALEERKPIIECDNCHKKLVETDLEKNYFVCAYCGNHFRMGARARLNRLLDTNSFAELDADLTSKNILGFQDYDTKLEAGKKSSGEKEAVITGTGEINGYQIAVFAMDPYFMMGSMGSIVGEKITRLFEYAKDKKLPVIGFSISGGARMQEGIISLMQMAKTSGAVKAHSDAGLLYISVMTNPTTGGVTASFASLGDIIIAEPNALIGFAGARVIEQTTHKKLPAGFQRAEFVLNKGFIDTIAARGQQKDLFTELLQLHNVKKKKGAADGTN